MTKPRAHEPPRGGGAAEEPITLGRIDRAIGVALGVVEAHRRAYVPVLRRLLEERDRLLQEDGVIARARAIVRGKDA